MDDLTTKETARDMERKLTTVVVSLETTISEVFFFLLKTLSFFFTYNALLTLKQKKYSNGHQGIYDVQNVEPELFDTEFERVFFL